MSAEGNVLMHVIKDEPQPEITEINSVCEEMLKVEPKCEEELNSCLIKRDFQLNDNCYDGHNTLKQEPNNLTTSNRILSNHIQLFEDDKSSTIIKSESEISVVTSKIDQPRHLPTEEASDGSKVQNVTSTVSFKTFSGLQEFGCNLQHVSIVKHRSEEFKCHKCSFVTEAKDYLLQHMKGKHGSEKFKFKCHQCSFVTIWKLCLLRHMEVKHGSEEFKCHKCSFVTKGKHYLLQHMKVHLGSKNFKCHQCNHATNWKSGLLKHLRVKHGSEKFKCHQCNFVTKAKPYLLKHMKWKHGSEQFKCQHCSFVTKTKFYLLKHMKVKHGSEEFKCQQCNYATNWKHNLLRHIKRHRKILK